ncbi:hypothetical protein RHMOL_Rhmol08G0205800 [Rhododendron molle]|uniref:Uncharacterized protein n=1 Tax=Rhododendron molle TaxID=49168 RepID=A0ACC0MQX0_RHOML|nr:hypothetical protein RHMOL_Rhmol08G0205800 [Rhododendron molle]
MEEGFQRLRVVLKAVVQCLEALEVENSLRCHPIKPQFLKEKEVSDDVSITKSWAGNHPSMGKTRVVKIVNNDSRL